MGDGEPIADELEVRSGSESASSYSAHEIEEINWRKSLESMKKAQSLPAKISVNEDEAEDEAENEPVFHERKKSHLVRRESALAWDMDAMTDLKEEMEQQLSVLASPRRRGTVELDFDNSTDVQKEAE